MELDEQLRHDMQSAVGTIDPPPAIALVDGGVQRGRRMRRMRVARVLGGVATAAVLGGAGLVAIDQLPGGYAEAPSDTAVASGDMQVASPEEPIRVTAQVVAQTLSRMLPDGTLSQYSGSEPSDDAMGPVIGSLVFDDGAGAALISARVGPAAPGISCAPPHPSPLVQCTELEQPDGSEVVVIQRPEYTDGRMPGMLTWWAWHLRTDGTMIEVYELNAVAEKVPPPTRELPPLTVEQLTEIVTSPEWQTEISPLEADAAHDLFEPRTLEP